MAQEWFYLAPKEETVEKGSKGSGWFGPPKGDHVAGSQGGRGTTRKKYSLKELRGRFEILNAEFHRVDKKLADITKEDVRAGRITMKEVEKLARRKVRYWKASGIALGQWSKAARESRKK